ncbi:MAG: hypothetical protein AB7N29_16960 [Vicinamibacterales bacterium]
MLRRPRAVYHRAAAILVALAAAAPPLAGGTQDAPEQPELAIHLAPRHEHYRPRIRAAARESERRFREWLGPPPPGMVLVDPESPQAPRNADSPVLLDLPWLSAPPTMDVEAQVAFALARAWWPGWTREVAARPLVDGLAWYLQSRVTPELFSAGFGRPGHSADSVRFFGGTIPWAFPPLVGGPWSAGIRQVPPGADALTSRVALAFGAIERLVGWPAMEGALAALAPRATAGAMTPAEIEQVISAAVGYPLSWLMEPARQGRRIDYAIDAVTAVPCAGRPCWRTTVVLANRGDAAFSGVNGEDTDGPYEQGDALLVLLRFDGGAEASARWDGRAASRTFEFESATPPVEVQLDPAGLLLVDRNVLDHSWRAEANTTVPMTKWIAWWLLWVQDAVLSHTALI